MAKKITIVDELSAGTITLRQATVRIAAEASLLPLLAALHGAPPAALAEARKLARDARLLELDVERAYVEREPA